MKLSPIIIGIPAITIVICICILNYGNESSNKKSEVIETIETVVEPAFQPYIATELSFIHNGERKLFYWKESDIFPVYIRGQQYYEFNDSDGNRWTVSSEQCVKRRYWVTEKRE